MAKVLVATEMPSELALKLVSESYDLLAKSIQPFFITNFFNGTSDLGVETAVKMFIKSTTEVVKMKNDISDNKLYIKPNETFQARAVEVLVTEDIDQEGEEEYEFGTMNKADAMAGRICNNYINVASNVLEAVATTPAMQRIARRNMKKEVLKSQAIDVARDTAKLAIGVSAGVALGIKFSGVLKNNYSSVSNSSANCLFAHVL